MKTIEAKSLRNIVELEKIPAQPGIYRWYAPLKTLEKLSCSFPGFDKIKSRISQTLQHGGETYYLVYVGTACRKNSGGVRKRLGWHVSDKHTESSVRNGALSTLRQSISSLVAKNQRAESATNAVIDTMLIKYECFDLPLGAPATLKTIEDEEQELITKFFPILNIRDNHPPYPENAEFKKFLKRERSASKKAALGA